MADSAPILSPPYASLTDRFYREAETAPFPRAKTLLVSEGTAACLDLDPIWLARLEGVRWMLGQAGGQPRPIAMAYAGHQFGRFSRSLGDGRAVILGHLKDRDGRDHDLAVKGAGPTPFTHRGDGYLTLSAAIAEFEISEALAARKIPATRVLAVLTTGETITREGPEPGGILVRIASSHIRFGSFQYAWARRDSDALLRLARWTLARHAPASDPLDNPGLAVLDLAVERQASLVAQWMKHGFVHGVLNTDNMLVSGEAMDLSTGGFTATRDPAAVLSAVDREGRYAFGRQPAMVRWGLARLAEALLPIIDRDPQIALPLAQAAVSRFERRFAEALEADHSPVAPSRVALSKI